MKKRMKRSFQSSIINLSRAHIHTRKTPLGICLYEVMAGLHMLGVTAGRRGGIRMEIRGSFNNNNGRNSPRDRMIYGELCLVRRHNWHQLRAAAAAC